MNFCCCPDHVRGPVYEVQTKDRQGRIQTHKYHNVEDFDSDQIKNAQRILRVQESDYDELMSQYKDNKQWTDIEFPPGSQSLGMITNIPEDCEWRRISDILHRPELFDGKVEPKDVIAGSLSSCYFLSAVAALAEVQHRIYNIFGEQEFSPNGIYRLKLRVDGFIREVLIDDYVPVNKAGRPLFCQPNKNQFWVVILEKAWAKVNGSYANIQSGTPTEVFRAVTYAPADLKLIRPTQAHRDRLWSQIVYHCSQSRPCCCGAKDAETIEGLCYPNKGIIPGHAYTLLNALNIRDQEDEIHRMIKLRDPWGNNNWTGEGNCNDDAFWNRFPTSQQFEDFHRANEMGNDGVFFMKYADFCQYFNEVNVCHLMEKSAYEVEEMYADAKDGTYFMFNVKEEDQYIFQLHQSKSKQIIEEAISDKPHQFSEEEARRQRLRKLISPPVENQIREEDEQDQKMNEEDDEEIKHMKPLQRLKQSVRQISQKKKNEQAEQSSNRATLILAHGKNYEFIDGILKYNDEVASIRTCLLPGKYFVFAKIDKDEVSKKFPEKMAVSSYSKNFVDIKPTQSSQLPDFFAKIFLEHARQNKKQEFDEGKMWVASKLLYEKGGYAYIAFGVDILSKKKFKIHFEKKEFNKMNFNIQRPLGKSELQQFQVLPGEEEIILARVDNNCHKKMTFPPKISIEIEQLKKEKK